VCQPHPVPVRNLIGASIAVAPGWGSTLGGQLKPARAGGSIFVPCLIPDPITGSGPVEFSDTTGAGVCSISEIAPTPRGTMDEFYRGEGAISALSLVEAMRQMKSIIHAGA
jgi:hypothetical protein